MSERYLHILSYGLIGEDERNELYRRVIFKDKTSDAEAELFVSKKEKPLLWADIEKLAKGGVVPPYRGSIVRFNGLNIIVFDKENMEEAYSRQKQHVTLKTIISYQEAEQLREESSGYITNLTRKGVIEIGWRPIAHKTSKIKFRYYSGEGNFVWGIWFEIQKM
jgi:hypothetical protein